LIDQSHPPEPKGACYLILADLVSDGDRHDLNVLLYLAALTLSEARWLGVYHHDPTRRPEEQ
jgi:hypothetical protein